MVKEKRKEQSRTKVASFVFFILITFLFSSAFAQNKYIMLINDNMCSNCKLQNSIQSLSMGTIVMVIKDSCGNKLVRYNGQSGFIFSASLGPYTQKPKPEPKEPKGPNGPGQFIFDRNELLKSKKSK